MKKTALGLLIALILLSACSRQMSLTGTNWMVENLDGKTALADVKVTLNFSKDSIGGSDGCNTFGGSYKSTTDGIIQFNNDIAATEMYCTDAINTQATTFYKVLKEVTDYQVDSQLLTLFNADGKKLAEFVPSQE
jgi:heat shock protein HslJ